MIQNLLRHLGGIEQYGIISLCLFCGVFVGVVIWALLQKQSHLEYMSRVALDSQTEPLPNQKDSHEA